MRWFSITFGKYANIVKYVYCPLMFTQGFYNGYNSIDKYDKKNKSLITDNIIRGLFIGTSYMTWYSPIAIYKTLGRLEIYLTNKNPNDYKYLYDELLSYTMLK